MTDCEESCDRYWTEDSDKIHCKNSCRIPITCANTCEAAYNESFDVCNSEECYKLALNELTSCANKCKTKIDN
jgi:hypothetical protein